MVDGAGQAPPSRVHCQTTIDCGKPRIGIHHCRRRWTIRTAAGTDKIEGIPQCSRARRRLLADVIGIVDRQMRTLAADVSHLGSCILTELLLYRKVPKLRVTWILTTWRPGTETHKIVHRYGRGDIRRRDIDGQCSVPLR